MPQSASSPTYTNRLSQEGSPYLLQHAHNPVDWFPWGEEAFAKARAEDKPVLVSIGYSACHWCHVMERESFEDPETAQLMNEHFVCIKVDREERPDVDQLYMDALQLMTGQGGWPLNVFTLPDGRPIYGGTYFPNPQWKSLLQQLRQVYDNDRAKVAEYAGKLTRGIQSINLVQQPEETLSLSPAEAIGFAETLARGFDVHQGGLGQAPKFPMPDVCRFLLRHHFHTQDALALSHTRLTLDRMALGGIYDQVGGGFSRYSTDRRWHIPHFEKMLYDNAQLMSLYAEAFRLTGDGLYRRVVEETFAFLRREMQHPEGALYAALDADSEGEEGRFYVWSIEEFRQLAGEEADLLADFFGVGHQAAWENGKQVLVQTDRLETFARERGLEVEALAGQVQRFRQRLLEARAQRVRPGLDDKILLSWNALAIEGLCEAYFALGEANYREVALQIEAFIQQYLAENETTLFHSYKDGRRQPGFLEDYAHYINALRSLHRATAEPAYLQRAASLTDYVIATFGDTTTSLFYFSPVESQELVANKLDFADNVIASPNAMMAHQLYDLGLVFGRSDWLQRARKMLAAVWPEASHQPYFHACWGMLMEKEVYPYHELAVGGPEAGQRYRRLAARFLPHHTAALAETEANELPLLRHRVGEQTRFYVCRDFACQMPVARPEEAEQQMQAAAGQA